MPAPQEEPRGLIRRARLSDLDASHPQVRAAIDAVRRWRDRYQAKADPALDIEPPRAPSLILSGPNGTGKTHMARAILWSVTVCPEDSDGRPLREAARPAGRWFAAPDLLLNLAPAETEYRTVEYAPVSSLIGAAPLVVVDDLGGEGVIPFVKAEYQEFERQSRWFRFIDFCYVNDVPLIITTNLDIQSGALAAWVGRRAWDRLSEMAPAGQMVGLWDVPSWRVKAGGR
jgi:DNA replication protein DnaC